MHCPAHTRSAAARYSRAASRWPLCVARPARHASDRVRRVSRVRRVPVATACFIFLRLRASLSLRLFAGHSGLGLRPESAAAATTEAHDQEERTSSDADSVPMEVLCCGRELGLDRDMENSSDPPAQSSSVSTAEPVQARHPSTSRTCHVMHCERGSRTRLIAGH